MSLPLDVLALVVPSHCLARYFPTGSVLAPAFEALLDVPCGKLVISKILGYGIVAGSALVKLPQIIKIVKGKSVAGLSGSSVNIEMLSSTCSLAYYAGLGYPFSTYALRQTRISVRVPLPLTRRPAQVGREPVPLPPE